jgi:hypothetical protein
VLVKKKNSFFVHAPFVMIVMVLVVVSALVFSGGFCVSAVDQASSGLAEADRAVGEAFGAVSEAEQAGANVTGLLARLNVAAELLAQAEIAVRKGDSSAGAKADSALSIAAEVKAAAATARNKALKDGANALWSSIVFPAEGAIVFGLALFLVWSWLRRRHIRDMLEAKPEVSSQ